MKLLNITMVSNTELKNNSFTAWVEGKTDELKVLESKLWEANEVLAIKIDWSHIYSGIEAVQPTKKEPKVTFKMSHFLECSFTVHNGDPIELINDIAGNIQHLID